MKLKAKRNELKRVLALNGYTPNAFCEKHKVSKTLLYNILNHSVEVSATTGRKISKGLKRDVSELFEVVEKRQKEVI